MLHPVGGRSRACAPCRGGVRGAARRRHARDRRQDVRHAASDRGKARARPRSGRTSHECRWPTSSSLRTITRRSARACARSSRASTTNTGWRATTTASFPREFHRAMADAGWLGITMPEEYGGAGLGVTEAAIMMHEVASHGGGMAAASAVHINLFGPHPIVVQGTAGAEGALGAAPGRRRGPMLLRLHRAGRRPRTRRAIKTFAQKVPGGYLVHGQKVWTSTAQVANKIMLLTRTTKYEDCARPTDGITIFYTDLDRSRSTCSASRRWAARRSTPTRSSSTACSFRKPTGSARRARASPTSCTASIPSAS